LNFTRFPSLIGRIRTYDPKTDTVLFATFPSLIGRIRTNNVKFYC